MLLLVIFWDCRSCDYYQISCWLTVHLASKGFLWAYQHLDVVLWSQQQKSCSEKQILLVWRYPKRQTFQDQNLCNSVLLGRRRTDASLYPSVEVFQSTSHRPLLQGSYKKSIHWWYSSMGSRYGMEYSLILTVTITVLTLTDHKTSSDQDSKQGRPFLCRVCSKIKLMNGAAWYEQMLSTTIAQPCIDMLHRGLWLSVVNDWHCWLGNLGTTKKTAF